MLNSIAVSNIHGVSAKITLDERTLILGQNGAGKTTLLQGAFLARFGYFPGCNKKEVFLHASGNPMSAEIEANGHVVRRMYVEKKGKVSENITLDGVPVQAREAEEEIAKAIGSNLLFDMPSFLALSPAKQRMAMLEMVASHEEVETAFTEESQARVALTRLRQVCKAAEETVRTLTEQMLSVERTPGNLEAMTKEHDELCERIGDLKKRKESQAKDAERRAKLTATIAERPSAEELARLEEDIEADKNLLAKQEQAVEDAERGVADAFMESIPIEVEELLSDVCGFLLRLEDDTDAQNLRRRIKKIIYGRTDNKESVQALRNARDAVKVRRESLDKATKLLAKRQADLESAQKATDELDALPSDDGDFSYDDQLAGLEKRRTELNTQMQGFSEIKAISAQCEKAKITQEKAIGEEEAAKERLQKAVDGLSKMVDGARQSLIHQAASVIPYGALHIEDDGTAFRLGWEKETDVVVYHSGLSGSEKIIFEAAVARAFAGRDCAIILDAGECSNKTLIDVAHHLSEKDTGQCIVARWLDDGKVFSVDGFKEVRL